MPPPWLDRDLNRSGGQPNQWPTSQVPANPRDYSTVKSLSVCCHHLSGFLQAQRARRERSMNTLMFAFTSNNHKQENLVMNTMTDE